MIKTDYKTKTENTAIFSSSRKKNSFPVVLMAVIALVLVVWGLSTKLSQPQEDKIEALLPLQVVPLTSEGKNLPTNISPESKLQEIPLNFLHDDQSVNDKSKTNINPDKPEEPSTTNKQTDPKSVEQFDWKKTTIRTGDSMALIFRRLDFSPSDLHAIISIGKKTAVLKNVKPSKRLLYSRDHKQKLQALRYSINNLKTLTVSKINNEWSAKIDNKKVELRLANARGIINSSLFLAGKNAGLTDAMVMDLAGIFGWDIDFILDIRSGDQFTLIYEEKYVEGEKIGNGNILAAEFINRGKSYQAVRYADSSGHAEYFTPAGISMRKAFLRNPVDFSYISSKFNPRRFHPILKRVKAHNGVDYRAPKGTPVKAAGDGKVIVSAYSRYNGHHVFVQHGQKYVTKYLHFSKRKVRRGQKVKQGQIIGYVGATGLAEAPHLHYEFLVNGVHRNPSTIKLPDAEPIRRKEKDQFLKQTRNLVEQLDIQNLIYDAKFTTTD